MTTLVAHTQSGAIRLRNVNIHFGEGKTAVQALRGIDLDVAAGELVSILGPSGCGKSTIIGAVAGFTSVSSGALDVDGQPVRAPGPDRGVVFQQHTLFPWKTVLENVSFGLKMRGIGKQERAGAAREILAHVGLSELFVTHDVDEAVFLSDRVVVLSRRPGMVKAELAVNLPRPRTIELLTRPDFMNIKREALDLLLDTGREQRGRGAA
jgi:ABC-type nitrate/sulfonate/bicarbonate transport system ATPase subunit